MEIRKKGIYNNMESIIRLFTRRHVFFKIAIIVAIVFAGNAISIYNFSKIDEACKADVAIVLGAAAYHDEVSPVFKERIHHAVWLYQNHYVEKIIMTGGYGDGNVRSDAFLAKQYAIAQEIPEDDILLEEKSVITQENLTYAKIMMEEKQYHTAILVSDPLHMKRAMLLAEDSGIEAFSSPTPTTKYVGFKSKAVFLARETFFYTGYQLYRLFAE